MAHNREAFNIEEDSDLRYNTGEEKTPRSYFIRIAAISLGAFALLAVIFPIIVLSSAKHAQPENTSAVGVIRYIEENIKTPLIQDITVSLSESCEEGFEKVLLNKWPGTGAGCYWPGDQDAEIRVGKCPGEIPATQTRQKHHHHHQHHHNGTNQTNTTVVVRKEHQETANSESNSKTVNKTVVNGTAERRMLADVNTTYDHNSTSSTNGNQTVNSTVTVKTETFVEHNEEEYAGAEEEYEGAEEDVADEHHHHHHHHHDEEYVDEHHHHHHHHHDEAEHVKYQNNTHYSEHVEHIYKNRTHRINRTEDVVVAGPEYKEIDARAGRDLYSWKNNSICVRRYNKDAGLVWVGENDTCATNHTRCAGICVPQPLKCPVTGFDFNQTQYHNTVHNNITILRIAGDAPLLKIEATIDEKPCLSNGHEPRSRHHYHPLLTETPQGCGKYGHDHSAHVVDHEWVDEILIDNGLGEAIHNVPGYKNYTRGQDVLLIARHRLGLTQNDFCLRHDTANFGKANAVIGSTGVVIGFIAAALALGLGAAGLTAWYVYNAYKRDLTLYETALTLLNWRILTSATATIGALAVAYASSKALAKKLQSEVDYFGALRDNDCFNDSRVDHAISEFGDFPSRADAFFGKVSTAFTLTLITYLIYVAGYLVKKYVR